MHDHLAENTVLSSAAGESAAGARHFSPTALETVPHPRRLPYLGFGLSICEKERVIPTAQSTSRQFPGHAPEDQPWESAPSLQKGFSFSQFGLSLSLSAACPPVRNLVEHAGIARMSRSGPRAKWSAYTLQRGEVFARPPIPLGSRASSSLCKPALFLARVSSFRFRDRPRPPPEVHSWRSGAHGSYGGGRGGDARRQPMGSGVGWCAHPSRPRPSSASGRRTGGKGRPLG